PAMICWSFSGYAPGKIRTECCPAAVSRRGRTWKLRWSGSCVRRSLLLPMCTACCTCSNAERRQYFYLARVHSWSADPGDRAGPEFADPARGEYRLQAMPLTAEALMAIGLKPDELAEFLVSHLGAGIDLFALADLRTGLVSGTEPAVSDSGAGLKPTNR
ncbi:MAG: hydrolase, partial [Actinomycetia bacterium]|nr:hydrolase [Actinomycetes bacterium]